MILDEIHLETYKDVFGWEVVFSSNLFTDIKGNIWNKLRNAAKLET